MSKKEKMSNWEWPPRVWIHTLDRKGVVSVHALVHFEPEHEHHEYLSVEEHKALLATQAKRIAEMEAEIERMNKIYMSAVKQRGEFRQALRESREETKATDLAADMQRLDYAAELDALKAQLADAIELTKEYVIGFDCDIRNGVHPENCLPCRARSLLAKLKSKGAGETKKEGGE